MTKAEHMWKLQEELLTAESNLDEWVCDLLGDQSVSCVEHDWYDSSLEIYGLEEDRILLEEELDQIWEYGFIRVWTHTVQSTSGKRHESNVERYYFHPTKTRRD